MLTKMLAIAEMCSFRKRVLFHIKLYIILASNDLYFVFFFFSFKGVQ